MTEYQEKHTKRQENGQQTITKITNTIKTVQEIPENLTHGIIVYIYKNQGGPGECGNYRPIFITQIIYKIRSGVITRILTKIMHIRTRYNQFGRLQRRDIRNRRHHRGRAIHRKCHKRSQNPINGPIKSIRRDQQNAPMGNTIQERNTNIHDKTHKTRTPRY